MNSKDAAAVQSAKRKRTKSTSETSVEASETISEQIEQAKISFANSIKTEIVAGGIAKALSDISKGDFGEAGDTAIASLQGFIGGIQKETKVLEAIEVPSKLLPSLEDCDV